MVVMGGCGGDGRLRQIETSSKQRWLRMLLLVTVSLSLLLVRMVSLARGRVLYCLRTPLMRACSIRIAAA